MTSPFQTIKTLLFGSIVSPLVWLLFAIALLYFLIGVVRYIVNGDSPDGRKAGRQHMFWGIIGLAIMFSAFGIVVFVFNSVIAIGGNTGVDGKQVQTPGILQPSNQNFNSQ